MGGFVVCAIAEGEMAMRVGTGRLALRNLARGLWVAAVTGRRKAIGIAVDRCLGAVVLGLMLLTGCAADNHHPSDLPAARETPGSAAESTDEQAVLESFRNRSPLPVCGDVAVGVANELPASVISCMADEEGAELKVSRVTTEGSPIIQVIRVGPKIDGVQVFTDSTRDLFGKNVWTVDLCPGPFVWPLIC